MLGNLGYFLIFLSIIFWQAQSPADKILNVSDFDVDVLGHIYALQDGVLNKYDKDLKKLSSFSDFSLGTISSLEAEDALNIMLYFSDDEKVIFLDNNLNIKRTAIDLSMMGYEEATLACASYNTGFWIYNPVRMEVVRFNRLLEKTNSTGNLQQILGESLNPQRLRETENTLILSDTNSGVFIFDRYGAFIRKVPVLQVDDFQLNDNKINLLKNDSLFVFDMKMLNTDTLTLQPKTMRFRFSTEFFYYLNQNGVLHRKKL